MKFPPVRETRPRDIRVLNRVSGYPVHGKTTIYDSSQTIDPETVPLNGGFLIKSLVLSIDPYLRGLMLGPTAKTYAVRQPPIRFQSMRLTNLIWICEAHVCRGGTVRFGITNYPAHCCMLI
jgi:hypothetical protein